MKMKRDEIKRKVDQIYENYYGAERQRRIQQFIASLGKERHEELADQLTDSVEERLNQMYGLGTPKPLNTDTPPHPIEQMLSSGEIPKSLLHDPRPLQPFLPATIEKKKMSVEEFEKWLIYQLGK